MTQKRSLTRRDLSIIAAAQLGADLSTREIARRAGCTERVTSYALDRLRAQGVISICPFLDLYRLGLSEFGIYFSLSTTDLASRERLLSTLKASERVSWFASYMGDYRYAMSLYARTPADMLDYLEEVFERSKVPFFEKTVSLRVRFTGYALKFLGGKRSKDCLSFGTVSSSRSLDENDHKILRAISDARSGQVSAVARLAKLPESTVRFRLNGLRRDGVYLGSFYDVDLSRLGLVSFRLLLLARGNSQGLRARLERFCHEHPNIILFATCIGQWDFEIGIVVDGPKQMTGIVDEIAANFGKEIDTAKTLTFLDCLKNEPYPFRKLRA